MNKRGSSLGEQIFSFAFIGMLVIVAIGLALGVSLFYGEGYEFRKVDAKVLAILIDRCFMEREIESIKGNLFELCGINNNAFERKNKDQLEYLAGILICKNVDYDKCVLGEFGSGEEFYRYGSNFESCFFSGKNRNYAICDFHEIKVEGDSYKVISKANREFSI